MSNKSILKKNKAKNYLCIYETDDSPFYDYKFKCDSLIYGNIKRCVKAPDKRFWIELIFDMEKEQVYY